MQREATEKIFMQTTLITTLQEDNQEMAKVIKVL